MKQERNLLDVVVALQHRNISTLLQYFSLLMADVYAEGFLDIFNKEDYEELTEDIDKIRDTNSWVYLNVLMEEDNKQ